MSGDDDDFWIKLGLASGILITAYRILTPNFPCNNCGHYHSITLRVCPGCERLLCINCWGTGEDGYCEDCSEHVECSNCDDVCLLADMHTCKQCDELVCDDCWDQGEDDNCADCTDEMKIACPKCGRPTWPGHIYVCGYCGDEYCLVCGSSESFCSGSCCNNYYDDGD